MLVTPVSDKQSTGFSRFLRTPSPPIYPQLARTLKDSSSQATQTDIDTGNSWLVSPAKFDFVESEQLSDHIMQSLPDLKPLQTTFGKKILESKEPNLNLENSLSTSTVQWTGMQSLLTQQPETLIPFHRRSKFVIGNLSARFVQSIFDQLDSLDLAEYIGAQQILEKPIAVGKKQVWTLILKFPAASFGKLTRVKKMLSSMNLEEESTTISSSGGWMGIKSSWIAKDPVTPFLLGSSGLHPICIPDNGTPT